MIFVFILVAAFIFLCLWGMVKMGSDADEQLMDYFSGDENRSRDGFFNRDGVLRAGPININNFSTEYSEEFVDEIGNIGEDVFDELPDDENDDTKSDMDEELYGARNYNDDWEN